MEKQTIRLKAISYNADFRKNERTLYTELQKSKSFPGHLGKNEAYLFVSKNEDQLVWLLGSDQIGGTPEHPIIVLNSRRWRIQGGSWSPKMLANYAEYCNLELAGIKKFEQAFNEKRHRNQVDADNKHDTIFVGEDAPNVVKKPTRGTPPKIIRKNEVRAEEPGRLRTRGRPRAPISGPTLAAGAAP